MKERNIDNLHDYIEQWLSMVCEFAGKTHTGREQT